MAPLRPLLCAALCFCLAEGANAAGTNSTGGESQTGAPTPQSTSLSRLKFLVGQLYQMQSSRDEREDPNSERDDGRAPLILDDESTRRSLFTTCACDSYLSGASAASPTLCAKEEAKQIVCRMGTPNCPSDQMPCTIDPLASPAPRAADVGALEFVDAELQPRAKKSKGVHVDEARRQ
ncbi:hypothetical protein AB1Y20_023516 [Prymnesium parvum]|uniref:Uncharacterized protein n=1 Tax=Prymnesium parvum TaxID=97485 RepID=A0AB34JEP4_PRYPA